MIFRLFIILMTLAVMTLSQMARAEIPPEQAVGVTDAQRLSLARQFLAKVKRGFAEADTKWQRKNETNADKARRLPEGEDILLNIRLPKKIVLDTSILGRAENGLILLSLRDFIIAVNFPIEVNTEAGTASGWYIRENRKFDLDAKSRTVTSFAGTFQMSQDVKAAEDDIYVPIDELASWFGIKLDLNVNALEMALESPTPLPIQEKQARQGFSTNNYRVGPPKLPLKKEDEKPIDVPFVDVSTRSAYERDGEDGKGNTRATAAIRTSGDFAYGTLTTQSTIEKDDKLTNVRATYKRESLEKELLGPLKARRYEVGDVTPTPIELRTLPTQGLGARITDAHPLRNTLRPSTVITGTSFPGWDVELYRDEQLIAYQTVGDDGVYTFEDVDLFSDENNFRVVFYGLQGEINEEEVSIPVDTSRIADMGTAYDVTIAAQNTQTFRKNQIDNEDVGAPSVSAVYEFPIGEKTVASAGFESGSDGGEQEYVGHAGLSTTMAGFLLNLDTAADNKGEAAAQLVARREIRKHQLRNELKVSTDKFGIANYGVNAGDIFTTTDEEDQVVDVFSERLNLTGPFAFDIGNATRYNLGVGYYMQSDDDKRIESTAGLSTVLSRINFGQQFTYSANDIAEDTLNSKTTVTGNFGRNRVRLISDYQMKPESRLAQVTAEYNRNITRKLDMDVDLTHRIDPRLTEASTQLNWDAGFANISPGVSYNSDNDLRATLNTRFGLARNPRDGKAKFFERNITSNGGISAFVFLDKDGDNRFGEGDEVIPDAVVKAPQNGGNLVTDENGYAFFANLAAMRPTDVFVDSESLKDPYWISGYEGVSIIPREGHVTELEFPIHMSGEMDGTVYARNDEGQSYALRGVAISLYDMKGNKLQTTMSESDGFYLFERVPPGTYYLTVDGGSYKSSMARPRPQEITFGYDGTTIYGKNIYFMESHGDVPVHFSSERQEEEHIVADKKIIINVGSYNSRLTMGLAWFKLKSFLSHELENLILVEKPSESYPDPNTGKYNLRLVMESDNFEKAYEICRNLSLKNQECSLDVMPLEKQVVANRQ